MKSIQRLLYELVYECVRSQREETKRKGLVIWSDFALYDEVIGQSWGEGAEKGLGKKIKSLRITYLRSYSRLFEGGSGNLMAISFIIVFISVVSFNIITMKHRIRM